MSAHVKRGHISKRKVKRKDGTVNTIYRARIPNPHGKRQTDQIERVFKFKGDAERWLAQQGALMYEGAHIDPARAKLSFGEVAQLWQAEWMALEPKTREGYKTILDAHLLPAFGARAIGDITTPAIQAFIADLAERRAPKTVHNIHVALSACLTVAVRHGRVRSNPAHGAKLPTIEPREMIFLGADEVHKLANAMPRDQDRLAVYVASITGLRAGELWALRRRDLELDAKIPRLHVSRSLKELGDRLEFGKPKTKRSIRSVSLPAFLVGELRDHLAGLPDDPDALLFTSPEGFPVRHGLFVRRTFRRVVRETLPHKADLRWHDLRHTAVALAIDTGVHVAEIMARMGHSSVTTTIDRYGHLMPNADGRLAAALDGAFSGEVVTLRPAASA